MEGLERSAEAKTERDKDRREITEMKEGNIWNARGNKRVEEKQPCVKYQRQIIQFS